MHIFLFTKLDYQVISGSNLNESKFLICSLKIDLLNCTGNLLKHEAFSMRISVT